MRIAMPDKGCLHEPTIKLLKHAGLHLDNGAERKLYVGTADPDATVLFARAADIPGYVRDGAAEVDIMGFDQIRESGHELEDLFDLEYGKCRLVLAAPENGDIGTVADVSDKVVAIEFPYIARTYFEEEGIDAEVVGVTGAIELTPHVEMADAIIDITSTGTTLRANRLAVIDEVLSSSVRLFAHPDVVDDPKAQQLLMVFESIRFAEGKRYPMMNAPCEKLDEVKEVIPGLGGPIVMDVAGDSTVAVHAAMNEHDVSEVVSDLENVGVNDILVTEIERLVE